MSTWGGSRATAAKSECQRVYGYTCWLCGHAIPPEDYTVDHVVERSKGGDVWDIANMRPAHGRRHPEIGCPGNYGRSGRRKPRMRTWTADGW